MVRPDIESKNTVAVQFSEIETYLRKNPKHSLKLGERSGVAKDDRWEYSIVRDDSNGQLVSATFLDNASISELYMSSGDNVRPIKFKMTNIGYFFSSLPFGIIFILGARFLARRLRVES